MYALHGRPHALHRWHPEESLLWRGRWVVLAILAATLLTLAYTQAAGVGPIAGEGGPVRYETVTVAPGDTLWTIATRRYPDADAREKVGEIEQANGLSSPVIEPGQRLRVPTR
jgi:LysM repeat protein